jgi:hypothetical protein
MGKLLRLDLDFLGSSMLKILVQEAEECGYSFEQLIESNLLSDKETEKVLYVSYVYYIIDLFRETL